MGKLKQAFIIGKRIIAVVLAMYFLKLFIFGGELPPYEIIAPLAILTLAIVLIQ